MASLAPGDDLRATTQGEVSRARDRASELAVILGALGDTAREVVELSPDDLETMAIRLQSVVLSGLVMLNDLASIAGRLAALGAVRREM